MILAHAAALSLCTLCPSAGLIAEPGQHLRDMPGAVIQQPLVAPVAPDWLFPRPQQPGPHLPYPAEGLLFLV